MATQNPDFAPVPFSITHPFTNVRLLEASDEVLDLISKGERLTLKSAPASGSADDEGHLHLCSREKAWAVKQVSTSNSVYIVRPQMIPQEDAGGVDVDMSTVVSASTGITAFAKPTSMLELYPVSASSYEDIATEHLRRLVPVYSTGDSEAGLERSGGPTLLSLTSDIPIADEAIGRAISKLCVFSLDSGCYIPSESALLAAWKKMVDACTLGSMSIGDLDDEKAEGLLKDEENRAMIAIAEAMFVEHGLFDGLGLRDKSSGKPRLKEMDTARWVGNLLLAQDKSKSLESELFTSSWEDSVPASWIKYCSIEVLGNACEVVITEQGKEAVRWRPFTLDGDKEQNARNGGGSSNVKTASAAVTGKRKWHEKFAAQRNAKK